MIFANPLIPALALPLVIEVIFTILLCPSAAYQQSNKLPSLPVSSTKVSMSPSHHSNIPPPSRRSKRSPFIVAFQVTRPPGLFQVSMKKPVIMGVMSNMTSLMLGSELARMLSRGLNIQQLFVSSNITSSENSTKKFV